MNIDQKTSGVNGLLSPEEEAAQLFWEASFQNADSTGSASEMSLFDAASGGYAQTVARILEREGGAGAQNWTNGLTPLMEAAYQGHLKCVELLAPHSDLSAKSDLNTRTWSEHTAASIAMMSRRWDCATFLAQKSDPSWVGPSGKTLLALTAERGEAPLAFFEALCSQGGVHAKDPAGYTPFMLFFGWRNKAAEADKDGPEARAIARLLAGDGSSLDAKGSSGETALMLAVESRVSLDHYKDWLPRMRVEAVNKHRNSAMSLALQADGQPGVVRALSEWLPLPAIQSALREALATKGDALGECALGLMDALPWEEVDQITRENETAAQSKAKFWAEWETRTLKKAIDANADATPTENRPGAHASEKGIAAPRRL